MEQILFGAKRAEKGSASYTARKEPRMVQHPTLLEKFTDVAIALFHVTKFFTISFFLRKLSAKQSFAIASSVTCSEIRQNCLTVWGGAVTPLSPSLQWKTIEREDRKDIHQTCSTPLQLKVGGRKDWRKKQIRHHITTGPLSADFLRGS